LRAFEAAGRHLSFSRAADELHVTQSAVSRHVRALEDALGQRLFRRTGRAVALTPEGGRYFAALRDCFDHMDEATRGLRRARQEPILTVDILPTLATRWLIPRLPSFTDAHPRVEVRMITSIRPVDLAREDIDVAIRVGLPPDTPAPPDAPRIDLVMTTEWAGLRAARLFDDVLVAVCSRRLLEPGPPLRRPDDLRYHVLLHTASRPHAWPDWLRAVGHPGIKPRDEISYGHFFMTLQAASEGRGVAVIPEILLANDLATGNLVMPFPHRVASAGAYYLLYRAEQADVPKVRLFKEWILAAAEHPDN
jgi:LysR family glycine cleavage system transcriptional activator